MLSAPGTQRVRKVGAAPWLHAVAVLEVCPRITSITGDAPSGPRMRITRFKSGCDTHRNCPSEVGAIPCTSEEANEIVPPPSTGTLLITLIGVEAVVSGAW